LIINFWSIVVKVHDVYRYVLIEFEPNTNSCVR